MKRTATTKTPVVLCLGGWFLFNAAALPAQDGSASGRGAVAGTVFDGQTGRPIPDALVEVVERTDVKSVTDVNGNYRLYLPPSVYRIKLGASGYMPMVLEAVSVNANEVTDGSSVLTTATSVTTVEVVEKIVAESATAGSVLTQRKLAETVSDAVSGQEMRGGTASDAAGALEKVPGVSVVGDKFVYVRGLGERYSATSLNNALLATTETEKRVVPLDLFPVQLIDQIKVLKTYTPDLPGEFAGGLVQIDTIQFPTKRMLEVKQKIGFNSRTTGKRWLGDAAGGRDRTRSIPTVVPSDKRVLRGNYPRDELQQFGRAFPVDWEPVAQDSIRPSQTYSVVAGDTIGKLGIVGAATYTNAVQTLNENLNFFSPPSAGSTKPVLYAGYDYDSYTNGIRLGALFNTAYQLTPGNRISWKNFLSRDTDNEARYFEGYSEDFGATIRNTRLRWIERQIYSTQVDGDHMLAGLGNTILNWQLSYSRANRDEPNLREVLYRKFDENSNVFYLTPDSQSPFRMFNYLTDNIYQPSVNLRIPFYRGGFAGLFKTGVAHTRRKRNFSSRRFRMNAVNTYTVDLTKPANEVLSLDNIRPDGWELREDTRSTDTYLADQDIYAAYGMADLSITPRLRVIAGLRVENSRQRVDTFDNFVPELKPVRARLDNTDPLPGVNVIFAATHRQNLRFGYSRTVSRPDFRELSPFDFTDVTGGRTVIGNSALRRAGIANFDGRWEWFPGGDQLVALSFFYKRFTDPIEQTVQATSGLRTSFANAKGAKNYGLEAEFRRSLAFLSPKLKEFTAASNFTFVDSEVELADDVFNVATSKVRPLAGQSRYIWNVATEWSRPKWRSNSRFFANVVSRRISDVGSFGLPDIYEERNVFLDFTYTFNPREDGKIQFRFSAENLLDNTFRFTQSGELFTRQQPGRTYSVGTTFVVF